MHKKLATVSAIALLAIATTGRHQASASQPTPLPRTHCYNYGVADWSGFYAGAHLGMGFRRDSDATDTLSVQGGGGGGGGGSILDFTPNQEASTSNKIAPTNEARTGGAGGAGNGGKGGVGVTFVDTDTNTETTYSGNGGDNNGGGGGGGYAPSDAQNGNSNTGTGGDGAANGQGGAVGEGGQGTGGGGSNGGKGGTDPGSHAAGGGGGGGGDGGSIGGGGGGNGRIATISSDDQMAERMALAGVHAGYNWQCGQLLLGVEGDWTAMEQPDNYLASLRGRFGMVRGNHLFYLTAGLAWTRVDTTGTMFGLSAAGGSGGSRGGAADDDGERTDALVPARGYFVGGTGGAGAAANTVSNSANRKLGFVVGGGIATKLNYRTSVGLEALYYGFDSGDTAFDPDTFVVRGRLTSHLSRRASPTQTPAARWDGLYIGVNGGGAFGLGGTITDVAFANGQDGGRGSVGSTTTEEVRYDTAGGGGGAGAAAAVALSDMAPLLGGFHLGRNWQRGRWVFGLEGELSAVEDRFDYLATLRGRLGVIRDQSLFYLTAGLAVADVSSKASGGVVRVTSGEDGDNGVVVQKGTNMANPSLGGAGGTASFEPNSSSSGGVETALVLGAGMEVKLRENLSLGIQGLYYFFDEDISAVHAYIGDRKVDIGQDDGFYTVKARLTYHFGHREEDTRELEPLK